MTYEEYKKAVVASVKQGLKTYKLSDDELNAFIEENEDTVIDDYEENIENLETGEITEEEMKNGGVSATAGCLELLY